MLRFPSDEQLNQATVVMAFTKALLISRKEPLRNETPAFPI